MRRPSDGVGPLPNTWFMLFMLYIVKMNMSALHIYELHMNEPTFIHHLDLDVREIVV